jgi:hypothetical protein
VAPARRRAQRQDLLPVLQAARATRAQAARPLAARLAQPVELAARLAQPVERAAQVVRAQRPARRRSNNASDEARGR